VGNQTAAEELPSAVEREKRTKMVEVKGGFGGQEVLTGSLGGWQEKEFVVSAEKEGKEDMTK